MRELVLRRGARSPAGHGPMLGVLLLLASGLVASTGGPLFRAIEAATPWQILFYRALGMLLVVGLFAWARAGWRLDRAFDPIGWRGATAAACLAGASVCYITALALTTAERPSDLDLLGGFVLLTGLVLQGAWGLRRAPPVPEVLP